MSKRYIDADALGIGKADRNAFTVPEYADGWNSAIEIIANAPTADVAEVRHGHWKYVDGDSGYSDLECSECRATTAFFDDERFNYCPNCGAKMDGETCDIDAFIEQIKSCSYTVIKDTADVVEVVRCKDCRLCKYNTSVNIYMCDRRGYYAESVKPTDYCSYGVRREE